jgi:hypothetical protein
MMQFSPESALNPYCFPLFHPTSDPVSIPPFPLTKEPPTAQQVLILIPQVSKVVYHDVYDKIFRCKVSSCVFPPKSPNSLFNQDGQFILLLLLSLSWSIHHTQVTYQINPGSIKEIHNSIPVQRYSQATADNSKERTTYRLAFAELSVPILKFNN